MGRGRASPASAQAEGGQRPEPAEASPDDVSEGRGELHAAGRSIDEPIGVPDGPEELQAALPDLPVSKV